MLNNLPEEMRNYNQWIVWKYEESQGGKPTKVPYSANSNRMASVSDPSTWSSFETACKALPYGFSGVGFVFTEQDPFAGIDLDDAYALNADGSPKFKNPQEILDRQIKIFNEFGSYSELSPSGKGLHIIVRGAVASGRKRASIEVYSSGRFFTMTGNVYKNTHIVEKQELLTVLWQQMGGTTSNAANYNEEYDEKSTDQEILEQASNALNGEKFKTLLEGRWQDLYSSQSEADFAFVDIIAYYTQNRNQIARIFRHSALGQRDKAQRSDYVQYMLNKSFDRMLPPVDIEGLSNVLSDAIAKQTATAQAQAKSSAPAPKNAAAEFDASPSPVAVNPQSPYTVPTGLLGEIASFIYQASPRPVPEIALAAAISLMSGICGRAYNVSGTGLNQYVLLLAPTGTGKEAMASGIDILMGAIKTQVPASKQFIGPAEIASGQALLKFISKASPCFLSIVGEFGLKMQQLSGRNVNASELMLKRVLLDLYNKSGNGKTLQQSIYSQKENNTEALESPSMTLLGESTPETFLAAIDESMIADGLLPRFTVIEYTGMRPPLSKTAKDAKPTFQLVDKLAELTANCLRLMAGNNGQSLVVNIALEPEAQKIADAFDTYADRLINSARSDTIRHLWNRAHIKLLKLAAICAVGVNPYAPVITLEQILWSKNIVEHDCNLLMGRFERGEIGADNDEAKQTSTMLTAIKIYVTCEYDKVKAYNPLPTMHKDKVVPFVYLSRRLSAQMVFRKDRYGANAAIKKTLQALVDTNVIAEIPMSKVNKDYSTSQKAYAIVDSKFVLAANDRAV